MKKKMVVLICMLAALALLAGCSAAGPSEVVPDEKTPGAGEVTAETLAGLLPGLMEKENEIDSIFRGSGLAVTENAEYVPDANGQCFVTVTDKKYPDVATLKTETEKVFTPEFAQELFYQYAFEGQYVRYKDIDGKLAIDIGQGGAVNCEWLPKSAKITEESETGFVITMDYINYDSTYPATINLTKTEDGLRISGLQK